LLADAAAKPLVPAKAENGEAPLPNAELDLPSGVEGAGAAEDFAQAGTALTGVGAVAAAVVDDAFGV
jgi:hypothetical protein